MDFGKSGQMTVKRIENHQYQKILLSKIISFIAAILHPLLEKGFKSEITSLHFFSPKDSKSLKTFDIQPREVGAKKSLNGTSEVNRHTHGRTHGRKFQLIEHRPML